MDIYRESIKEYLDEHPEATGVEISRELGLPLPTVYGHLAKMREEHVLSDYPNLANI